MRSIIVSLFDTRPFLTNCCLKIPRNPWFLVISELLDGLCGFSVVVAGSYYCAAEAPPGMLASLNGIVVAAMYGAG